MLWAVMNLLETAIVPTHVNMQATMCSCPISSMFAHHGVAWLFALDTDRPPCCSIGAGTSLTYPQNSKDLCTVYNTLQAELLVHHTYARICCVLSLLAVTQLRCTQQQWSAAYTSTALLL
jgi:hypothetical protein